MDQLRIRGGKPLHGTIDISGAKNASLPLMCAALLSDAPLHLSNVPHLMDISTLIHLLSHMGVDVHMPEKTNGGHGHRLTLHAAAIRDTTAPYEQVSQMRASILVLGPTLARMGVARVSLPGGCAIGARPIDIHLDALSAMGADIDLADGYVEARAPRGLTAVEYTFPMVSVGASENIIMAAVLAKGTSVLRNVAREPEVADLCNCLVAMGATITGIGTDVVTIQGATSLHEASHTILPDRIETASYAFAAAITGGALTLRGSKLEYIAAVAKVLRKAGVSIHEDATGIHVRRTEPTLHAVDVATAPYPAYPTDAQAQLIATMCVADGTSIITENIFENRFMHVPELIRMGADISLHGSTATVRGVDRLKGAPVMATDLRASMGLVLAGLAADGETLLNRVYHLDRGYERLEEKLSAVGADIRRLKTRSTKG